MEKLYDVKQTAEFLNVKVSTIRCWIQQGRIPVIKLGGSVRIKHSTIEKIIEEGLNERSKK